MSFETQFKIEYLLLGTGSIKALGITLVCNKKLFLSSEKGYWMILMSSWSFTVTLDESSNSELWFCPSLDFEIRKTSLMKQDVLVYQKMKNLKIWYYAVLESLTVPDIATCLFISNAAFFNSASVLLNFMNWASNVA